MPVTELGPMVVKPGLDVMDENTPEGKIVTDAWKGVTSEKTGPFRVYWGMEVETPQNFWAFFDFESVEEHKKFAKEYASLDVQGIIGPHGRPISHGLLSVTNKHTDTEFTTSKALTRSLSVWFSRSI